MLWVLIAMLIVAEVVVKLRALASLPLHVLTCADRGGRYAAYAPPPHRRSE